MCSASSEVLVDAVVDEYVTTRTPFTALTVSMTVKKRGGSERHRQMRDYIHGAVSRRIQTDKTWERTLIDPPGCPAGTPQAFLYFPTEFDPKDFGKDPKDDPNTNISGQFAPAPVIPSVSGAWSQVFGAATTPPKPVANVPDGAVAPDAANRVCISKKLISDLGLKPGDTVHVLVDQGGNKIELCKTADPNASQDLTVDLRQTVRINPATLKAAGLIGTALLDVAPAGDRITVKAH